MRAIQVVEPGKVALLDDAPAPEPEDGEVLVRCSHVALCGSNMGPYLGDGRWAQLDYPNPPGWQGHENIGTIVESRCPGWQPGTLVLAHPEDYCGFAELIRARLPGLVALPADADDVAALMVAQPLATVLRALRRTAPVVDQRCAVVGQGPMGLIFTHLLGRMGARQVIGIDLVPWRLEWAKRFGATHVVDASQADPVEAVRGLTDGEMVDFSVEAVGQVDSLATAARLPRRLGRLLVFGVPHHDTQDFPWWDAFRNELEIVASVGPECTEFFAAAVGMVVERRVALGAMVTPRLPWHEAPRAFEMYAHPAAHEGALKVTLEVG
jgi:L-iditol 2-dehydrogenase